MHWLFPLSLATVRFAASSSPVGQIVLVRLSPIPSSSLALALFSVAGCSPIGVSNPKASFVAPLKLFLFYALLIPVMFLVPIQAFPKFFIFAINAEYYSYFAALAYDPDVATNPNCGHDSDSITLLIWMLLMRISSLSILILLIMMVMRWLWSLMIWVKLILVMWNQ